MSQTSYSFYQSLPFAGMIGDYVTPDLRSYTNQEATLSMPFGIFVGKGASDTGCILLADVNTKILGVSVHNHAVEPYYQATSPAGAGQLPKSVVSVMKKGRIWVLAEVDMVPGNTVWGRHTANGGLTQKGAVRNTVDTANATQVTQAEVLTTATAGNPILLDLNMP